MKSFPSYMQHDSMDCGPTCLRMVAAHYSRVFSLEGLREKSLITREGVSMLGISEAAEHIGFRTTGVKVSFDDLKEAPLPCIVHWNQQHFVARRPASPNEGSHDRFFLFVEFAFFDGKASFIFINLM